MRDEGDDITLSPELLLHGYSVGVFPMAESADDTDVYWVDPRKRGVMPLDAFRASRSLRRAMRKPQWRATLDTCFDEVLRRCAAREETWINREIADAYRKLHRLGRAHSLEIWAEEELAGGVYGVTLGAAFFGESMFSARTDGSKIALACLVDHLRRCGYVLFDTQFITPHLASLGAREIPRAVYHHRLEAALDLQANILSQTVAQPQEVVQRMTQTS